MKSQRVLVLGDGLLGSEIVKQTGWDYISRKKDGFDINNINLPWSEYDIIINCIANTDTYSNDKQKHWDVNYAFVKNLIDLCNSSGHKLVHISTDYLYSNSVSNATEEDVPVHQSNWYGYTKLLGDGLVQLLSNKYLICRCGHKPTPFPYDKAWNNQRGNFDYVDVIASLIIRAVKQDLIGVYNIGTEVKSIYDLALRTKDVQPTTAPDHAPKDITMNLTKLVKSLNVTNSTSG